MTVARVTAVRATAASTGPGAVRATELRGTAVIKLGLPPVRVTQVRATAVLVLGGGAFAGAPGGDVW